MIRKKIQNFWRFIIHITILWQTPFIFIAEHKEQIEKAEEKERLQKEKEEKQEKEAEEKANGENFKANEEDMGHRNEAEKHLDVEDNAVASNHDKIGKIDDSSADQVWLYLLLRLQNFILLLSTLIWFLIVNMRWHYMYMLFLIFY